MAFSMATGRAFRALVKAPALQAPLRQMLPSLRANNQLGLTSAPRWLHCMPTLRTQSSTEAPLAMDAGLVAAINNDVSRAKPLFAVVHVGGKQYRVTADDVIVTNLLPLAVGERIKLEKVLLAAGPSFSLVGQPLLENNAVTVVAEVAEQYRGAKVIAFKKKRRKGYARKKGHRQALTKLRIRSVTIDTNSL
eukprot:m.19600 g.19600  ORF g.19600 m.19600 type:complete len:192 (+) comp10932_c0_seq3:2451-3026(+)